MNEHDITSLEQLRSLYRAPSERVAAKKADHIGPATAATLAASPFALLATADADGRCDVSPRGGRPGQVKVLDDRHIALADLSGNNLIDSLTNIVANPHAGLLVLTPGSDETLRIDGPAKLTTDPAILHLWDDEVRTPKVAIVIETAAVFMHCAKAFRRSDLWDPTQWPADPLDACRMFVEHGGEEADDATVAQMRVALEADYAASLAEERASGDRA